jgi:uncharacterized OB-fold protein
MKLQDRELVTPEVTPETKPYWDAAARRELTLRRCKACGQAHHYPRTNCPFCFSDQTVWETASGNGVIYSFSIMRQGEGTYVIAYVKLAEGPIMMTNLVDCDTDRITVGKAVRVVFKAADGAAQLPMFALLDE